MQPKTDLQKLTHAATPQEAAYLAYSFQFTERSYETATSVEGESFDYFDAFLRHYVAVQMVEDKVRHSLALGYKLAQDWQYCVSFYEQLNQTPRLQPEKSPVYFFSYEIKGVATKEEFATNFKKLTGGIFEGLNMYNFVVSGGAVLSCLMPNCSREFMTEYLAEKLDNDLEEEAARMHLQAGKYPELTGLNGFFTSDIDVFVHGLSETDASIRVNELLKALSERNQYSIVSQSKQAITLLGNNARDIQIVLRLYDKPAEILLGFDIDCAAVAYDFSTVYATPRSLFSIVNRVNVLNQKRRSTSYAARLIKYGRRGFYICIPGFSRQFLTVSQVPIAATKAPSTPELLHTRTKNEQMFLERLDDRGRQCYNLLPQGDINQVIEADITWSSSACEFGIDQDLYYYYLKQLVIIANNVAVENKLYNAFLTSQRRMQTQATSSVKTSRAINATTVEADEITENQITMFHERVSEYDVLSHQFSAKSDYCYAISFGFHSASALRFRYNNPKSLPNLYVGPYRWGQALCFVTQNPGKYDLFTSSFHPENGMGYYGDLRLFLGKNVFNTAFYPSTEASFDEKLFFLNHFCSLPASLVAAYYKGRIEKQKFAEVQKMRREVDYKAEEDTISYYTLYEMWNLLSNSQYSIAECISMCEQRYALSDQPLEIGNNFRYLFRWTWYLQLGDDAITTADQTYALLYRNMISDIEKCKIEGNNIEEYLKIQEEVEARLQQFEVQLTYIYNELRQTGKAALQLHDRAITIYNEHVSEIFSALTELQLTDKFELGLFKIEDKPLDVDFEEKQQHLMMRLQADLLDLDAAKALIKSKISLSVMQFTKITLAYDLSYIQLKLSLSNVQLFQDVVRETASYDTLCALYRQFYTFVEKYQIAPQDPQLFVYQGQLLYINRLQEIADALSAQQIDGYLIDNLGIGRNYIASVREMGMLEDQTIEVPLRMIRDLQCRKNRYFFSELPVKLQSLSLQDRFLPFKIVKSAHYQLVISFDGKELPTYQFVRELVDECGVNAKTPHFQLFLIGKAIAYALQNSIPLSIGHLPMCLFRALLLETTPTYSKYNADAARYDLAAAGIDFQAIQSREVNGFVMTREKLGNDGFDALLANQLTAEWKKVVECVVDGFVSLGGCGGYAQYNACQIRTLICGK